MAGRKRLRLPVDTNDELAKAIGRVSAHLTGAEFMLAQVFSELISMATETTQNGLGVALFYSTRNNRARSDMILAVLNTAEIEDGQRQQTEKAMRRFDKLAIRRNDYLHAAILAEERDGEPFAILYAPARKRRDPFPSIKIVEINRLADDISVLSNDLVELHKALRGF